MNLFRKLACAAALAASAQGAWPGAPGALSVCPAGCDFQDLQRAVDAAPSGGTVEVSGGIQGTCAVIRKPLTVRGLRRPDGQRPHLMGKVCGGKAALVATVENIVIEGLELSNLTVPEGNGACVRMDPGTRDLAIRDVHCHGAQMGILGNVEGHLVIEDTTVESTLSGPAYSHAVYLAKGGEALLRRCKILSAKNAGHLLKSGMAKLTVEDSVIAALDGRNSRALDAFGGGEIVLRRNVIEQGPYSDNNEVIGIGLEPKRLLPGPHSLVMEGNWVVFDDPARGSRILLRQGQAASVELSGNVLVGLTGTGGNTDREEGNRWFSSREEAGLPPYDGSVKSLPSPGGKPARGR